MCEGARCPQCFSMMESVERNSADESDLQFFICRDCVVLAEFRNGNVRYTAKSEEHSGWSQWRWNAREKIEEAVVEVDRNPRAEPDAAEGSPAAD